MGVWKATAEAGEAAGKVGAARRARATRSGAPPRLPPVSEGRSGRGRGCGRTWFVVRGVVGGRPGRTTSLWWGCEKRQLLFFHKSVDSPLSHTQMPPLHLTACLAVLAAFAATDQAAASSKANEQELTQVLATVRVCEKKGKRGDRTARRAVARMRQQPRPARPSSRAARPSPSIHTTRSQP